MVSRPQSFDSDADHESAESWIDEFEKVNEAELIRQRDNSLRDFEEGRGVSWEQVKRENGL